VTLASVAATSWRMSRGSRVGVAMLLTILVASYLIPALSTYDPLRGAGIPLRPPSSEHLFGTDNLGRDVFTRTFAATRLDTSLALAGVSIPFVIGTLIGALLGTTRNKLVSSVVSTLIDGINAFPLLVLVIGLVAAFGPGVKGLLIALALTNWARYAKVARSRSMVVREQDYIQATSVLGYSRGRTLFRHVIPNVSAETVAYALSDLVIVIITIAGLSFLGLGVRPPTAEWGAMISDGRLYLRQAWWVAVFPGLALSWTGVAIALIAEGVARRQRAEL